MGWEGGKWRVEGWIYSDTDSSEAESLGFAMEGWSGWPVCLWKGDGRLAW